MNLGQRLRQLRKEKKLTQTQLARHFNLAESTISLYENNKRSPDYLTLLEISLFFNVSVDYLLGNTSHKKSVNYIFNSNIPVVSDVYITGQKTAAPAKTKDIFWYPVSHNGFQTSGILAGDLLLVEPYDGINCDGAIYLVQTENAALEACRIVSQNQLLIFHMLNPAKKAKVLSPSNQENIWIVGKVLELKRRYI